MVHFQGNLTSCLARCPLVGSVPGHDDVLFKPTKAAEYQFRPTAEEAMSYFVGGDAVDGGYKEDAGFAINGGKGWKDCVCDYICSNSKFERIFLTSNFLLTSSNV